MSFDFNKIHNNSELNVGYTFKVKIELKCPYQFYHDKNIDELINEYETYVKEKLPKWNILYYNIFLSPEEQQNRKTRKNTLWFIVERQFIVINDFWEIGSYFKNVSEVFDNLNYCIKTNTIKICQISGGFFNLHINQKFISNIRQHYVYIYFYDAKINILKLDNIGYMSTPIWFNPDSIINKIDYDFTIPENEKDGYYYRFMKLNVNKY